MGQRGRVRTGVGMPINSHNAGTAASRFATLHTLGDVEDQIHRRVGEAGGATRRWLPGAPQRGRKLCQAPWLMASMVCGGVLYSASASSPPFESTRFMLWVKADAAEAQAPADGAPQACRDAHSLPLAPHWPPPRPGAA